MNDSTNEVIDFVSTSIYLTIEDTDSLTILNYMLGFCEINELSVLDEKKRNYLNRRNESQ